MCLKIHTENCSDVQQMNGNIGSTLFLKVLSLFSLNSIFCVDLFNIASILCCKLMARNLRACISPCLHFIKTLELLAHSQQSLNP